MFKLGQTISFNYLNKCCLISHVGLEVDWTLKARLAPPPRSYHGCSRLTSSGLSDMHAFIHFTNSFSVRFHSFHDFIHCLHSFISPTHSLTAFIHFITSLTYRFHYNVTNLLTAHMHSFIDLHGLL